MALQKYTSLKYAPFKMWDMVPFHKPVTYESERTQDACEIEKIHSLEVVMHSTLHPVGLQAEVNVATPPVIDVVLVEYVIQALIQVLQVQ